MVLYLALHPGQVKGTIEEKEPTFAWIRRGDVSTAIFYEDIIEKDIDGEIPWGTVERSDTERNLAGYGNSAWSRLAHNARDPERH